MNDFLVQLTRILLRYIGTVLVTKGVNNEAMLSLFQDEAVVQAVAGGLILILTEASWIRGQIQKRFQ